MQLVRKELVAFFLEYLSLIILQYILKPSHFLFVFILSVKGNGVCIG